MTNRKLCGEDFLTRMEKIAAGKPAGIILREKDLSGPEYRALAKQVMEVCSRQDVLCILHSFPDAALALGAEAIHLPMAVLRGMTAERKRSFQVIGVSCHSAEEARETQRLGCTYITAGHIFATDCKRGLPGRGLEFLEEVCRSVSVPVYAIGGVTPERFPAVLGAGADGACVMSGLMTCADAEAYLRRFG